MSLWDTTVYICIIPIGVGNVVLQVAAAANCTCYGIEKNETPAEFAKVDI